MVFLLGFVSAILTSLKQIISAPGSKSVLPASKINFRPGEGNSKHFYSFINPAYSILILFFIFCFYCLPAYAQSTTSWINPSGGSWNDTGNWSDGVPSSGSDVIINLKGTYTITVDNPVTVKSLALGASGGTQTLELNNNLSLNGTGSITAGGKFVFTSGTINGSGSMTNDGTFICSGSAAKVVAINFDNQGTAEFAASIYFYNPFTSEKQGKIKITDDIQIYSGYSGSFNNKGSIVKSAGSGTAKISAVFFNQDSIKVLSGNLMISGSPSYLYGGTYYTGSGDTLMFNSSSIYARGHLSGKPDGIIINNSSQVFADSVEADLDFTGTGLKWTGGYFSKRGSGSWVNNGMIYAESSDGKVINAPFVNKAEIQINASTATYSSFVNNPGAVVSIADNSTISSGYGGYFDNKGLFIKPSGTGTANVTATFVNEDSVIINAGNLVISSGPTYLFGGTYHTGSNDTLILQSAAVYAKGRLSGKPDGVIINKAANIYADSTEVDLDFTGNGFKWIGGNLSQRGSGSWVNNGMIYAEGSDGKVINAPFVNKAEIQINASTAVYSSFMNNPGAVVSIADNSTISSGYGGYFDNKGLFLKPSGSGAAKVTAVFVNEDSVIINSGNLVITGGPSYLFGGTFYTGKNDTLKFESGNVYAKGHLSGKPDGIIINNSSNIFADSVEADLNFTGTGLKWTGGSLSQIGEGSWVNEGMIYAESADSKVINAKFGNNGTFQMDATVSAYAPLINNSGGVFKLSDGAVLQDGYGGTFTNDGTLENTGAGESTITINLINGAGGKVTGAGTLHVTSLVKDYGTIAPGTSTGILTWDGNIHMDSSSAGIEDEIGGIQAGKDYGKLVTTGTVSLSGMLKINLINNFKPNDGQTFSILKASGITGLFDSLSGLVTSSLSLYPVVSDSSIILTARNSVPKISGKTDVTPTTAARGSFVMFYITGTGFAPDASFYLKCSNCSGTTSAPVIYGRIKNLTDTTANVQFDLRDPFITSGTYDLTATDPRGGSASFPVIINGGNNKLALRVTAQSPNASEKGPVPGVFLFELNDIPSAPVIVNYQLSGTAELNKDYITSTYGTVTIPAGQNKTTLFVTPIPDSVADDGETVIIKLLTSNDYTTPEQSTATVTIADGPPPSAFAVFASTPNSAGNNGTITMTVTGHNITKGATAYLKGSNSIYPSNVTVDSNGQIMNMLFDLTGQKPGNIYNLEVINGDGKSSEIIGALKIEQTIMPEISVQLSGPSSFRSYLPPQKYFVTVTNRGNLDAVAVPLSVAVWEASSFGTLVPKFPIVNFDPTKIQDVPPGFSGWGNLNAIERDGDRYILSVIIPLLKPGEAKTFIFLARSHHIKAWTSPISQPIATGGSNDFSQSNVKVPPKTMANIWTGMEPYHIASVTASNLARCAYVVGSSIYQRGPIGCLDKIALYGGRALNALYSLGSESNPSLSDEVTTSFSFNGGWVATALSCAGAANPWLDALSITVAIVSSAKACSSLFAEPKGKSINADDLRPSDPNDKTGPNGSGDVHYVAGLDAAGYMIKFENDTSANAPALFINIKDPLDVNNFDLNSFSLGPISFGDTTIIPPPGLKQWNTTVEIPGESRFVVRIFAGLDQQTGIVSWQLMAIDPATGTYPTDATAGFLPPDVNPPKGEGSVFFIIKPKTGLPSGTQLCNKAEITFDANDPIFTPQWCNTLDYDAPKSKMKPVEKAQSDSTFNIAWSGADATSGVSDYLIYVSTNRGPFALWADTSDTSAVFTGSPDSSYAFYSVARDLAGNLEHKADTAETSTSGITAADDKTVPRQYAVYQNYPNPFNPTTTIRFELPKSGNTKLEIFNVLGQLVATLVNGRLQAGRYSVNINAGRWASGVYLYRIRSGSFSSVKKMILLK